MQKDCSRKMRRPALKPANDAMPFCTADACKEKCLFGRVKELDGVRAIAYGAGNCGRFGA
jgi:hypothetical protein